MVMCEGGVPVQNHCCPAHPRDIPAGRASEDMMGSQDLEGIGEEAESHPLDEVGKRGHLSEYQVLGDTGWKEHVFQSVGSGAWSEAEHLEDR